jgi:hypothetical protein
MLTLHRYIAKAVDGYGKQRAVGRKTVLAAEPVNELYYLQSTEIIKLSL